jgi:heme oxygenase
MNGVHGWLRSTTATAHAQVDAAFSHFALDEAASYRSFLMAHAMALLPIEAWLREREETVLAGWPTPYRAAALEDDLGKLDAIAPPGAAFQASDDPAAIAAILYVLEGSRLGGNILAKRVGPGLPRSYLASASDAQSWRRTLSRLEDHIHDDETRKAATEAAFRVFERFEQAARSAPSDEAGESGVRAP